MTFGGQQTVTIPAHGKVISDPITFTVNGQQDMAVSLYYADANPAATSKPSSRTTSYCSSLAGSAGNRTNDTAATAFTTSGTWVRWVSAVDVYQSDPRGAIVTLGSSTTEGLNTTINQNKRWQDVVATYLLGSSNPKSIVPQGVSGDTVCSGNGMNGGVARVTREALSMANVSEVFLSSFGGNDISAGPTANAVIACYQNIINQARAAGVRIIGGTLTPRGLTSTPESYRQQVNTWIRTAGNFDAFVDLDAAVRNPSAPANWLPAYDSGDNLHPNDAGAAAWGQAVINAIGVFNASGGNSANGAGPGVYDDMDYWPFVYAGTPGNANSWIHDAAPNCYAGTRSWSAVTNDDVTVRFYGTQIQLYGVKKSNFGIGAVSIDGGAETNIDFYAATSAGNQLLWTSPVLPNGPHTFKLRVTGTRNASSSGNVIEPDAVVIGGPGVFDNLDSSIAYSGAGWLHDAACVPNCHKGTRS